MARNKLPKAIIKKYGISKKAWSVYRGKRRRKVTRKRAPPKRRRRSVRRKSRGSHRPMGIVGKINAGLRALRLGLPALGSLANSGGFTPGTPRSIVLRYAGYDIDSKEMNTDVLMVNAGFYAGNVIESKAMSMMKIPQMAGKKKLLSIAANFLPEITAIPQLVSGDFKGAMDTVGTAGIGYQATGHQSFVQNAGVRDEWVKTLGARLALGLMSRFVGPMINKHLPKGVNI